jgi:hypothetical protein
MLFLLASLNRRSKYIRVLQVIVAELELGSIGGFAK